jgi:hypothetical protein
MGRRLTNKTTGGWRGVRARKGATWGPAPMTEAQKAVIGWMYRENIGAVMFEDGYKFPNHFRMEAELAERFLAKGMAGRFEAETIPY